VPVVRLPLQNLIPTIEVKVFGINEVPVEVEGDGIDNVRFVNF